MTSYWISVGSKSNMTDVLIRQTFGQRDTGTQKRRSCEDGGRIGQMLLQAKECQGLLAITRSEERGKEEILSQSLQKEPNLSTP